MKTFNKRGDAGETSLLFDVRVPKDSLCCEAYGTLDEAVSCLGVARAVVRKEKTKTIISEIQQELFIAGAELATQLENYSKFTQRFKAINEDMVNRIEKLIDGLEQDTNLPKSFIIPGSDTGSALLDMSRSILRRAERRVATLKRNQSLNNKTLLPYLNRLADLLFILARYEETQLVT